MLSELPELVLILALALIILGPDQLPGLLRAVGKVVREFREISDGVMRELSGPVRGKPAFPTYKPRLTSPAAAPKAAEVAQTREQTEKPASGEVPVKTQSAES